MKIKPTKNPILNILFNDEEFIIVTEDQTIIYDLPIHDTKGIEISTYLNKLGICAIAKLSTSNFLILGES